MMKSIFIRISDNVLHTKDWPIWELLYNEDGMLQTCVSQHPGAYCYPEYKIPTGSHIDDLVDWAQYDPTGVHPESYHDVSDDPKDFHKWSVWNLSCDQLMEFMRGEIDDIGVNALAQSGETSE